MSYNNYLDGDAAYTAVSDIPQPACVVVKHTNPCGAATREDLLEAYRLAVKADPISAFGGIVAFNRYSTRFLGLLPFARGVSAHNDASDARCHEAVLRLLYAHS